MYRLDLNAAPDGMLLVDDQGMILFANQRAEQLFGARSGALLGSAVDDLIPARHRTAHAEQRTNYEKDATARRMGSLRGLTGLRADGVEIPLDISLSPLIEQGRRLVVVAVRDVSREHDADRTIRLQSAALESAANGIIITDRSGVITWVNPALLRMTGYSRQELVGQTPRILNAEVHDREFFATLWSTILAGEVWTGETTNRRKDGTLYCEEQTITPVGNERGAPEFFVAIKQDITARKQAMASLERRVEELTLLHQVAAAGINETTQGGFVQQVAKLVSEARYPESFRVGLIDRAGGVLKLWSTRATADERDVSMVPLPRVARQLARVESGLSRSALRLDAKNDCAGFASHICAPLLAQGRMIGVIGAKSEQPGAFDEDDERLIAILAANVAASVEKIRLFLAVERLALTDSLTGLHNRRHLHEVGAGEIGRARRHDRPLSLLMLDIDKFKDVNDTFGHAVGDRVIQLIARACKASVRNSDVCVRNGGDEFVVLLPDSDGEGARHIAERIRAAVRAAEVVVGPDSPTAQVTVSIGVATLSPADRDLDHLLSRADTALYSAKREGRDRTASDGLRPEA